MEIKHKLTWNAIHPTIKITIRKKEWHNTKFFDLIIHQKHNTLNLTRFTNPTSSQNIHNSSRHPNEHKRNEDIIKIRTSLANFQCVCFQYIESVAQTFGSIVSNEPAVSGFWIFRLTPLFKFLKFLPWCVLWNVLKMSIKIILNNCYKHIWTELPAHNRHCQCCCETRGDE